MERRREKRSEGNKFKRGQDHRPTWAIGKGVIRACSSYLTLLVIRNSCLFPWTNTDTRHTSANWVLAPQQSTLAQTFKGALQWLFCFIQSPEKKLESPKNYAQIEETKAQKMQVARVYPIVKFKSTEPQSREGAKLSLRHQTTLLASGLCLANRYHLIIFKWDVYSAFLGMSRSPHDSSTSNCFPFGHGHLT